MLQFSKNTEKSKSAVYQPTVSKLPELSPVSVAKSNVQLSVRVIRVRFSFSLSRSSISPENSRLFLNQSDSNSKPIAT